MRTVIFWSKKGNKGFGTGGTIALIAGIYGAGYLTRKVKEWWGRG